MTTTTAERRAAIRVPVEQPRGLLGRLARWYSRRVYGDVLDNGLVLWHHKRALLATLLFEKQVERFDALPPGLRALAELRAASVIGCSWCVDFGSWLAHREGLDLGRLREVATWQESTAFDPTERLVLEFTDAVTATPPTVTDELVDRLVDTLGVKATVELAKMVAVENERSRFNHALGLTSQGFSDRCGLPGD
ncbi:MAG TPA: carboxymuconolactone decarboxylase family protein [Ornithinicoccus sp.]|jgi:AhpD family alkylhydroperoxidase|nr:carboxymuconolactone decarboxylase family protein [Ornithinicoccus sp.]